MQEKNDFSCHFARVALPLWHQKTINFLYTTNIVMNTIKNFDELLAHLKENNVKKRVAVVWPADEKTPAACAQALEAGFI